MTADAWIDRLELEPHPEGGFFRETYRAPEATPRAALPARFDGARAWATSIYFLLPAGGVSRLHRLRQDEVWHFHAGGALTLHVLTPAGAYRPRRLGLEAGAAPQAVVEAGAWFGATVDAAAGDPARAYVLCGCAVAPGFDFADFELGDRDRLLRAFPQHAALVRRLTPAA